MILCILYVCTLCVCVYVCIYLVSLGLQGIVECPGLLELLVKLIHLLLMLLL